MKAQIGSISHGTLRTQDLLRACAGALEALGGAAEVEPAYRSEYVADAREWAARLDNEPCPQDEDCASQILCDISDKLQEYAPDGCYFGMHVGDGSDLGFWEMESEDA